ncbi:TM0106 family RecB-like putative nuclease [Corynebacterium caspium]|uniref:TM0106 family RecB-like putative nuclease n=1 Tax=Corynebacterium caspium TaxID=234828 RepID=UPI00036C06C3|nr:TM0106 family RecB-like putative nuclease [Corynebacterium caspium]WKD60006.1 hypothetical protein CCASP_08155 [Corynebacterium caspium DSM 44850]
MTVVDFLPTPADLVGCRWKAVQKRHFPEIANTAVSQERRARTMAAWVETAQLLPQHPAIGDKKNFRRIDIHSQDFAQELETLEAIAQQASLITRARFATADWAVQVDILVRMPDGTYIPIEVTNKRVARPGAGIVQALATKRLGLGEIFEVPARIRTNPMVNYSLGLAARALTELGVNSGLGGIIGQDRQRAYLIDTGAHQKDLDRALAQPIPTAPMRVRECDNCGFWKQCEPILVAADDISLFLPGGKAQSFRDQGINTVTELIEADLPQASALAKAWRAGVQILRRQPAITPAIPRFAHEIDIDMEAYLDHGAYLWGAWDGDTYQAFITWGELGTAAEGENFARFWAWLKPQLGPDVGVYCYSNNGENHLLRQSAKRFGGQRFGDLIAPELAEIEEFISSAQWIDVFAAVRGQLVGTQGLGLKVVAPHAGFQWRESGLDGEESINIYQVATDPAAPEEDRKKARNLLLSYNEDDCRATAAVRQWLAAGTPGVEVLTS